MEVAAFIIGMGAGVMLMTVIADYYQKKSDTQIMYWRRKYQEERKKNIAPIVKHYLQRQN